MLPLACAALIASSASCFASAADLSAAAFASAVLGGLGGGGSLSGGDSSGSGGGTGAYASPVALAKIAGKSEGGGPEVIGVGRSSENVGIGKNSAKIKEQTPLGIECELGENTCTCTCGKGGNTPHVRSEGEVRGEVEPPAFLIAPELIRPIPKNVNVCIVEITGNIVDGLDSLYTGPSETYTIARLNPLEGEELGADRETVVCVEHIAKMTFLEIPIRSGSGGIPASTYTDCPVRPKLVGLVATKFEFTILIPVGLLRKRRNCDQKGGSNCKKLFHTVFYLVN